MPDWNGIHIGKWVAVAGACALLVSVWFGQRASVPGGAPPVSQPRPLFLMSDQELLATCPPGHRAEFVFGGTSLFVDLRLFSVPSLQQIWARTNRNCPTEPEHAQRGGGLFFYLGREIGRVKEERNIQFTQLHLGGSGVDLSERGEMPTDPLARRSFPDGSYVEDITEHAAAWGVISIGSRAYRLQHAATPGRGLPPPIRMRCSDVPDRSAYVMHRTCSTTYRYGPDLGVRYEFAVSRGDPLRQPPGTPNASIAEPDGLLAFDARIRAWIDDLQRRP